MNAFDKELLKIFQSHNPNATPDEIQKWGDSHSLWAAQNYKNSAEWIGRTFQYLDGGLNKVDYEKFIINAHGLIIDLPHFIAGKIGIFKLLGFASVSDYRNYIIQEMKNLGMKIHLLQLLELNEVISTFADGFTAEEIFATTYFRNTYCHPALSAYTVKVSSKKKGVKFNPATYEAFRKLQPYAEVDLCKELFDKIAAKRGVLEKTRRLLLALKN